MPSAVTLNDVAIAAGVSLATASRAINGSQDRSVRPELRDRVLRAAAELDYSPNAHAQAMVHGTTTSVGLVVHDIADPYFSSIAAGVMKAAAERGLSVTMASTARDPDKELEYVILMRRQRVQAIILAGSRVDDTAATSGLAAELDRFHTGGGLSAVVSQQALPTDTVDIDNYNGARDLARALHDLGHRRFAVLAGRQELLTAQDRLAGFRAGLDERGVALPDTHIITSAFTRDGGHDGAIELLRLGLDVTCVHAVNDVMAVGAMAALREKGLQLPRDMAVAGFDDIATLRDITPGLTTVRIPLEEIGARALDLALQPPGNQARPRVHRVRGEVVFRDSTPRLPDPAT